MSLCIPEFYESTVMLLDKYFEFSMYSLNAYNDI